MTSYKRNMAIRNKRMFKTLLDITAVLMIITLVMLTFIFGFKALFTSLYYSMNNKNSLPAEKEIIYAVTYDEDLRFDIIDDFRFQDASLYGVSEVIEPLVEKPEIPQVFASRKKVVTQSDEDTVMILPNAILVKRDLPNKYYEGIDFSSFQPYMSYKAITNKSSEAYAVCNSELAYTDEHGFRRSKLNEDQFSVNGKDDYVIALGTYYKERGRCGLRFLIETTTGSYTAITGDEKADIHTDDLNMFSPHQGGTKAGLVEWIVDGSTIHSSIKRSGTVTTGPVPELAGEITAIYAIHE